MTKTIMHVLFRGHFYRIYYDSIQVAPPIISLSAIVGTWDKDLAHGQVERMKQ